MGWNDKADLPENQPIRDKASSYLDMEYLSRSGISRNWELRSDYLRFICKSKTAFIDEAHAWSVFWTPDKKTYYRM